MFKKNNVISSCQVTKMGSLHIRDNLSGQDRTFENIIVEECACANVLACPE